MTKLKLEVEVVSMGIKLLWVGLTLLEATRVWNPGNIPSVEIVGAVIMIIGAVLFVLDK